MFFWFVYPHALKASQSPQRSQRSQRPHRFERLNLAAAKKRGHIIHQRHLNTHNTNTITTRDSGYFLFFSFILSLSFVLAFCIVFGFSFVLFFKKEDRRK